MARKLRIQFPGAMYHVMNRGDHQGTIFGDEDDRKLFVATLAEGCEKTAFQIHSFCLMSNHLRLVVETPDANLVEGMKWLLGVYLSDTSPRPPWLRADRLPGEWGIAGDQPGTGARFSAAMEARRQAEREQEFKPVPRGWCVGSKQFRAEMLQYIEEQRGKWHYGAELSESAEAKAQRLTMGTRGHLAHLLYRNARPQSDPPEPGQARLNI